MNTFKLEPAARLEQFLKNADKDRLARRIVVTLMKSMKDSSWAEQYPEAYRELIEYYLLDMALDVNREINK